MKSTLEKKAKENSDIKWKRIKELSRMVGCSPEEMHIMLLLYKVSASTEDLVEVLDFKDNEELNKYLESLVTGRYLRISPPAPGHSGVYSLTETGRQLVHFAFDKKEQLQKY